MQVLGALAGPVPRRGNTGTRSDHPRPPRATILRLCHDSQAYAHFIYPPTQRLTPGRVPTDEPHFGDPLRVMC